MPPPVSQWTTRTFRQHGADAEIRCIHCPHKAIVAFHTLEMLFNDANLPAITMALRFRCKRCGGKGADLTAWFRKRR